MRAKSSRGRSPTSSQIAGPSRPIASRTAPSTDGASEASRYPTSSIIADAPPTWRGSWLRSVGSVSIRVNVMPRPAPDAQRPQARPVRGRRAIPQEAGRRRGGGGGRTSLDRLRPRRAPAGASTIAPRLAGAHDRHQRGRRPGRPAELDVDAGEPGSLPVVQPRLEPEQQGDRPHDAAPDRQVRPLEATRTGRGGIRARPAADDEDPRHEAHDGQDGDREHRPAPAAERGRERAPRAPHRGPRPRSCRRHRTRSRRPAGWASGRGRTSRRSGR